MQFESRGQAGKLLTEKLSRYKQDPDAMVIGLARGGMAVAALIAQELKLPLYVIVANKIGPLGDDGVIVGAITAGGATYFNQPLMDKLGITIQTLAPSIEIAKNQAMQRSELYRKNRSHLVMNDKTIILVDDGIIIPDAMLAAITSIRLLGAQKIIVAVPVIGREALAKLSKDVDEIVCLHIPEKMVTVGKFYDSYEQVTDEDVIKLLS